MTSFEIKNGTTFENFTDEYSLKKSTGEIRLPYSRAPRGFGNIKVVYEAGYSDETMPRDIVSAIIDIAVAMYNTKNTS
jgi:hypothetical protein